MNCEDFFAAQSSLKVNQQVIKEVDNEDSQYSGTVDNESGRNSSAGEGHRNDDKEGTAGDGGKPNSESDKSLRRGNGDAGKGVDGKTSTFNKHEFAYLSEPGRLEEKDQGDYDYSNSKRNSPKSIQQNILSVDKYGARLTEKKIPLRRDKSVKGMESYQSEGAQSQLNNNKQGNKSLTNPVVDSIKKKKDMGSMNHNSLSSTLHTTTGMSNNTPSSNLRKSFKEKNQIEISGGGTSKEETNGKVSVGLGLEEAPHIPTSPKPQDSDPRSNKERSVSEKLKKNDTKIADSSLRDGAFEPLMRKKKPGFQSEPPKKSSKPQNKTEKTPDTSFINVQKHTSTSKPPESNSNLLRDLRTKKTKYLRDG